MCLCPIYCFVLVVFLGLGVLGLFVPSLQSLDLLTVQTLSHHRLDYLNSITTFLARVGGMPFVCFLSFLVCVYLAWYKKFITVIFISLGVIGSITIGWLLKWCVNRPRLLRHIILLKVTVHRSQVHTVFMHQHWLVWQ